MIGLRRLRVSELALVEAAVIELGPGLNLLTGETGSGKSLIVDALGLALGGRGAADLVRRGAVRAIVEATFATPAGDSTLSRELGRRGGARIDGRPVGPADLRRLGRTLVVIHGQSEQQLLVDEDAQTRMLDGFGATARERGDVAGAHSDWSAAASRLSDLERSRDRGRQEDEYQRWQLQELRAAKLRLGEDEELAQERTAARSAARLTELVGGALAALRSD
ncbi:MAG: AAA family ATPase, partial [Candidatus Dormibacteraeota bacterium]|nr:AAA family ATPase [Candidatus Dormibacteraeota bacterium]